MCGCPGIGVTDDEENPGTLVVEVVAAIGGYDDAVNPETGTAGGGKSAP
jgi:hypothetical protein